MKQNKMKGSAILVVIFSSIAFFIYVMSVYSEAEHFNIIQNKYEKNINKKYEVDEDSGLLLQHNFKRTMKMNFMKKFLKNIKY